MLQSFWGIKLASKRIYDQAGYQLPVTEVAVSPAKVVQIKTLAKDGLNALQIGIDWQTGKKVSSPMSGHLKKAGLGKLRPRFLGELAVLDMVEAELKDKYPLGSEIKVEEIFSIGDVVKVTGISKSKGFQGVVKRYGFAGGPRTHGQSDRERAPGSIGQTTTPGRVYKGKRMAGRMGGKQVTISGLKIIGFDQEKNLMQIKGLIPGNSGQAVLIKLQKKASALG